MTSVIDTVKNNNARILKLLVTVPGSVSQKDLNQALLLAVKNGFTDCVDILLKSKANPDVETTSNVTALQIACDKGHQEISQLLIDSGCNLCQSNSRGSALHYAAKDGHTSCVQTLVQAGINVNLQDSNGNTPLLLAAKNCHYTVGVMKKLIEAKCVLNLTDNKNRTALHYCCHKAIGAELLLSAGADPNIQDVEGNAPIHLASIEGFDPIVKCLVLYNCDPDLKNTYNKTALHYLAMKNHWRGIEDIASIGGDMNVFDNDQKTPLWYAVNHNRPEAVKALIRANCQVSYQNPRPTDDAPPICVPLQIALTKGLYGIAKLLVLAGAELTPLYGWLTDIHQRQQQAENERMPWMFQGNDDSDDDENMDEKEALEWFEDWLHTPHSLRQICRIYIRQFIGIRLLQKGLQFPVPPAIIDYITLKEVHDHHVEGFLM